MVADEQQDGIGVQAQALQKIEENRLLDAPALAVLLDGPEIALLAFAHTGIVQSSECGALCAAKFDIVLPGRLAPLTRTEKKLCHRRRPFLPGDFFFIQQFARQVSVAQRLPSIEIYRKDMFRIDQKRGIDR